MASHYAALQGRFMLALDIQHVRMKQHATDKAQALQCLVDILVEDQLVTPDYIYGLTAREQQSATYLGQELPFRMGRLSLANVF